MRKIYIVIDGGYDGMAQIEAGAFFDRAIAEQMAKAKTSWGDGRIKEVEVYDSIEECEDAKKKEIAMAAMAKLTEKEREALGL